jgi:RimJ/RimL family protein N-acetyltransferase
MALASEAEVPFVVLVGGREVGSSRYLNVVPEHRRAEIGWTWLERPQWGTGANLETKFLLLENAFERAGLMRVEFKTDARNERVRGALLGIGGRGSRKLVLPRRDPRFGGTRSRTTSGRRRKVRSREDRPAPGVAERRLSLPASAAPHV